MWLVVILPSLQKYNDFCVFEILMIRGVINVAFYMKKQFFLLQILDLCHFDKVFETRAKVKFMIFSYLCT